MDISVASERGRGGTWWRGDVRGGLKWTPGVGHQLVVLDRTDPTHPVALGKSETLPGPVQSVTVDGAYAYVGFGTLGQVSASGLRIFDVSNDRHPVELGTLPGPASDIAVVRHYEYLAVASGAQGLRIVDVSDPAAPRVVAVFTPPGSIDRVTLAVGLAYTTGSVSSHTL